MRCPRYCEVDLRVVTLPELGEDVKVHLCDVCQGAWYPLGSLLRVGQCGRLSVERSELAQSLTGQKLESVDLEHPVRCPDCNQPMNRFTFSLAPTVKVDECLEHGTWLDDGELGPILDSIAESERDVADLRVIMADDSDTVEHLHAFNMRLLNTLLPSATA